MGKNINLRKVELKQVLAKDPNLKGDIEEVSYNVPKTEIRPIDINGLVNSLQIEINGTAAEEESGINKAPLNHNGMNNVSGQQVGPNVHHQVDINNLIIDAIVPQHMSENDILEEKIEALGLDVSSIRSFLNKKVTSLSRDEIFEIFDKIKPQLKSLVGQKFYEAGIELNSEFIDEVLNRIISRWEYSNNGIGGENYKVDFKFTKVIDLLQSIKNRINSAISHTINGNSQVYESNEILEGSFNGTYKTLMYNLLYTDDRYLSDEEKELKAALLSSDNINSEIDIFSDEALEQLDTYLDLFKNHVKSKYGYSEEYADNFLNFLKSKTLSSAKKYLKKHQNATITIQELLNKFTENGFKFLTAPELDFGGEYDGMTEVSDAYNFYMHIDSHSPLQLQFIETIIDKILEERNIEGSNETKAFLNLIFKGISSKLGIEIKRDEYGDIILSESDFEKLNSKSGGYDFSWVDEIYQIIQEEAAKINPNVDRNATTIDTNLLFAEFESIDAEYIYEHLDEMLLSNDGGVRKFAQFFVEKSSKNKLNLINQMIYFINFKTGSNDKLYITKDMIDTLNNNDIFSILEEVKNCSFVSNDYYIGDFYIIKQNGYILTITNLNTNETEVVDLEELTQYLPEDKKDMAIEVLLELPAEVLIDMKYESTFYDKSAEGTGGTYSHNGDNIHINSYTSSVMTHETGHAIACSQVYGDLAESPEFKSAFNEGLKAFLADGGIQNEGEWQGDTYVTTVEGPYCTRNSAECFAECYTFLMLGYVRGAGGMEQTLLLQKYFGECINLVAQYIKEIRNLSPSQRRK